MSLKTEKNRLQKQYRLHLNRIKTEYSLSDKELALLMGISDPQGDLVRQMRSGKAQIQSNRMITLCRNLIAEYQDYSLLQELMPEDYVAIAYQILENKDDIKGCVNTMMIYVGRITELSTQSGDETDFKEMAAHSIRIAEMATSIFHYSKNGGSK